MEFSNNRTPFIKNSNTQFILDAIRSSSVSRVELARLSGLSKPAISAIVDSLIKDGIVTEMLRENTERGRKPTLLSIVPYCLFSVGVVISREICCIGMVDLLGKIVRCSIIDSPYHTVYETVDNIAGTLKDILEKSGIPVNKVMGIGISMPGPVDSVSGRVLNPPNFDKWHNINITKMLTAVTGLPCYLENQATAHAIAERLFGCSGKYSNYVSLLIEDGIGSSIIVDGVQYNALNGLNPEFGHVSIDYNGKKCTCGGTGCLELYASEAAALDYASKAGIPAVKWEDIVDYAIKGDAVASDVIQKVAAYLSVVIIDILNILLPDAIIIQGKYKYKPDILLGYIHKNIANHYLFTQKNVDIVSSELDHDIFVLTSCSIVINKFLKGSLT